METMTFACNPDDGAPQRKPAAPVPDLRVGDDVRRRTTRSAVLGRQIGRVVRIQRTAGTIERVQVRFPCTWRRFHGGYGDSVQWLLPQNLVKLDPPTPEELRICPNCDGRGYLRADDEWGCRSCGGQGAIRRHSEVAP